jgi:hypothetical protein
MTWPAIIAFFLLLVSTFLLSIRIYVWDALLLGAVSLIILGVAEVRRRSTGRRWWRDLWALRPRGQPASGIAVAMVVSASVSLVARGTGAGRDFTIPFLLWAVALGIFVAASLRHGGLPKPDFGRDEAFALSGLLIVALLLRGVAVGRLPYSLGGDEGTQLVAGLGLVAPPLGNPFATGWYSVPTMSFFAYGVAMRVFGATVAGARSLSVLIGTLTVLTTFLMARTLAGRRAGWVAAAVVTFSGYHIHFSRLASNQIADPFFGTLAFWLVAVALKPNRVRGRRREAAWGLVGAVAGLGWYGYFGARWVTFMVALVVAWRWLVERTFLRRHARGLVLCVLGFLVAALPLLGWYSAHPSTLTERYNAVSIFASGWLAREVEITGKSLPALLLQQVWRAVSAFHLRPDPTFWYGARRPLLDFVTGALMLLGMVEAVLRLRWPSRALSLIWFWSTLVMAWVMTENPPSSQRGLLLVPAVALLAAWGVELLRRVFDLNRGALRAFAGILLFLAAAQSVTHYFFIYTPQRIYGNPTAEAATAFSRYTLDHPQPVCNTIDADTCPGRIYFLGPPYLYWDFGTLAFMLREFPGVDVPPGELPHSLPGPARFAVVPSRVPEVDALMALYPNGERVDIQTESGRLLMVVYDWVP